MPAEERAERQRRGEEEPEPTFEVTRHEVQLGGRDGDLVEVVEGLEPGQRIVGSGAAFLQAGEAVRVLARNQAHNRRRRKRQAQPRAKTFAAGSNRTWL